LLKKADSSVAVEVTFENSQPPNTKVGGYSWCGVGAPSRTAPSWLSKEVNAQHMEEGEGVAKKIVGKLH